MLAAVENALLPALKSALPTTPVQSGPAAESATEQVVLTARRLTLQPPPSGELRQARRGARLRSTQTLPASGQDRDFPVTQPGEISEVEMPPGRPLTRGDDYELLERTIQFYATPAAGQLVLVRLSCAAARGYVETLPCRIELELRCYGQTHERVDALLASGLAAMLAAGVELPWLEEAAAESLGVRQRLLRPLLALSELTRAAGQTPDAKAYLVAAAQLLLTGELETTVALGEAAPVGAIHEIRVGSAAGSNRYVRTP